MPNVHSIQDKITVKSISSYIGKNIEDSISVQTIGSNDTNIPIGPQPALIAPTGIKIFDEISTAMINNPSNPPDPILLKKIASIGIGPEKTSSVNTNDTIKTALQNGLTQGQKMIDAKVKNAGTSINGWMVTPKTGVYGDDYLFRVAVTQLGLGANIA